MIVPMEPVHARAAAQLHAEGLPDAFLTRLGHSFLTALYTLLSSSPWSFGFVALQGGTVTGFITATTNTDQLFKELVLRRGYRLLFPLLWQVVRHPAILKGLLETLRYPGKVAEGEAETELLSIVVRAEDRGKGLGRALLDQLLAECRRRSISRLRVSVDEVNEGANRFYRGHGFHHLDTVDIYGKRMNVYLRRIRRRAEGVR
ncbi:MAG: GNAT family N-acetyltransferase [Anaerolineae bacterium]